MGFVTPLVLLGLGALSIPVLIHLIQRERKRVVEFPSLMFLRRIPYQSVRRRRIRDWMLLAMRLAALALVVLAAAATGPGATRFAPALKLAGSLLAESALPRREIILISDFQRRGWEQTPGRDDVKLPERTTLTPVSVAGGETSNLSATAVSLQRTRFENHDRVAVTAGVVNHGPKPLSGVALAIEIDGQSIQSQSTTIVAGGSSSVTFAPFTVASRNMRGTVKLPDDALKRDNVFHFVVSPSEPVRVFVITRAGAEKQSLYLARALVIGESP